MRPPADGVAFAAARAASHNESKLPPITELRVTLTVTENGRPVPTKSDGARFASGGGGSGNGSGGGGTGNSAQPLDVTLKLRQGARYCFSLSCVAPSAPPSALTSAGRPPLAATAAPRSVALESAQATVWTRCAQPTPPPASAAGLHDVLGLLCCCGGGGAGSGGVDGGGGVGGGAAAGGRPGQEEGLALVAGRGRLGGGDSSNSGGGGDGGPDDDGGGAWQGGAQVPVAEGGGGGASGGGGGGRASGGAASRFELFWSPSDEIVTADGTRTEVCVELVFAAFGRARLCLLCKVGPPLSGSSGSGGGSGGGAGGDAGSGGGGGGGALRPSGACFHLLRSAMTGEVRVLSRVPL